MSESARDLDTIRDTLRHELHWHEFRPWVDGNWGAQPPEGVENPCGDCGRAEAAHPWPFLLGSEDFGWYFVLTEGVGEGGERED